MMQARFEKIGYGLFSDGVEVGLSGDVDDIVGDDGAAVDGRGEFDKA